MRCPQCDTENTLGSTYCAGCGAKLELSDAAAHVQAVAAVRRDSWQEAFRAMSRTLFFFFLVFVASLVFHAYATREIVADFSAVAPLPPPPPLELSPAFIQQPRLPIPEVVAPDHIGPTKDPEGRVLGEKRILEYLAGIARGRIPCTITLKTGRKVRGVLLARKGDEFHVITDTDWGPPIRPQVIKARDVLRHVLPEGAESAPFPR